MYETQTQSKKYRQLDKTLGAYFKSDNLYSELYKKNFKKTYAGKPTKKYLRIMEQIQKAESIPYHEIEKAMLIWNVSRKVSYFPNRKVLKVKTVISPWKGLFNIEMYLICTLFPKSIDNQLKLIFVSESNHHKTNKHKTNTKHT